MCNSLYLEAGVRISSLICFYGWHCLIWPFFLGFLKKYVIIENKRRWWNGRHACFRRMCPYGCEGSNPFLRIEQELLSKLTRVFLLKDYEIVLKFLSEKPAFFKKGWFSNLIILVLSRHPPDGQNLPKSRLPP